jgi:hypothetical protein
VFGRWGGGLVAKECGMWGKNEERGVRRRSEMRNRRRK